MKKRTKGTDITGWWTSKGDSIIKYERLPSGMKCSRCDGTDPDCPVCHGATVEPPIKWYQLGKKLKKWLE